MSYLAPVVRSTHKAATSNTTLDKDIFASLLSDINGTQTVYNDEIPADATAGIAIMQDAQYEIFKSHIGVFVTKLKGKSGVDLYKNKGTETFKRTCPLIPGKLLRGIHELFVKVNNDSSNEVMVHIYMNVKDNTFVVDVPKQVVAKATIRYENNSPYITDPDYVRVLDVHSHNTMGAFFSGTDNSDEVGTGYFAVIGQVDKPGITMVIRAGRNGNFIKLTVDDVFDMSSEEIESLPDSVMDNITYQSAVANTGVYSRTAYYDSAYGTTADVVDYYEYWAGYDKTKPNAKATRYQKPTYANLAEKWLSERSRKGYSYSRDMTSRLSYVNGCDVLESTPESVLETTYACLVARFNPIGLTSVMNVDNGTIVTSMLAACLISNIEESLYGPGEVQVEEVINCTLDMFKDWVVDMTKDDSEMALAFESEKMMDSLHTAMKSFYPETGPSDFQLLSEKELELIMDFEVYDAEVTKP